VFSTRSSALFPSLPPPGRRTHSHSSPMRCTLPPSLLRSLAFIALRCAFQWEEGSEKQGGKSSSDDGKTSAKRGRGGVADDEQITPGVGGVVALLLVVHVECMRDITGE